MVYSLTVMADSLDAEAIRQIIPFIEEWVRFTGFYHEVPGVSMAVQYKDELLSAKAFGKANIETGEALTPTTRFRIASHSKLFTATAIMELYAAEELSLDDKISKHLDWFTLKDDNIRIRHLLTHTSGMTRDSEFGQWYHHNFPTLEAFKELMQANNIEILEPAVQIKYSNIAYTLLGLIIEQVSGVSYHTYMEELCARLGLEHTTPMIGDTASLHTRGYKMRMPGETREAFVDVEAKVMDAATGFSSIPTDVLKFLRAQMIGQDRGLKYGDFFKREMQNLQFQTKETEWGLGFMRVKPFGELYLGHGGGYPGYITFSGFNPKTEVLLAIYCNTLAPPVMFGGMAGLLKYAHDNYRDFSGESRDLTQYEGIYRGHWRLMYVRQFNQQLLLMPLQAQDPTLALERLEWIAPDTFKIVETLPGGSKGQLLRFVDGNIEFGGATYQKWTYEY